MRKKVTLLVDNIFKDLQLYKTTSTDNRTTFSILAGEAGCYLFNKYYITYADKPDLFDKFEEQISHLAEHSIEAHYPTFCGGKAGINWFFSYLNKTGIISNEDYALVGDDDPLLVNDALKLLALKKYDFLHGAIGIAYHLLYARGNTYSEFFTAFFHYLNSLVVYNGTTAYISHFDILKNTAVDNHTNFGLSHGMPSILKFCIQCYRQGICKVESKELALQIIDLLRTYSNEDKKLCYFPCLVEFGGKKTGFSRLAWCYGDLGIGIILYQAAIAFEDNELEAFAMDVLFNCTKRKTFEQTHVRDAALCHGSAGIAHIYNRMWHYTNEKIFKNSCDYWIKQTINMANHQEGIGGFKSYHASDSSFHNSPILLEGSSGIGLALISYLTDDFSWDYCLMLND